MTAFNHHSYLRHTEGLADGQYLSRKSFEEYEKSADAWRHHRMMQPFRPFVLRKPGRWLTVGDGSGFDAARLARMGVADVTASDLTVAKLQHAVDEGLISKCCAQNAEKMSTNDGEYDVVYCKEAFHHFPRPWIGLYEMIRTASEVVLLTEPRDWFIDRGAVQTRGPVGLMKGLLFWLQCRLLGLPIATEKSDLYTLSDNLPRYEDVGNFVFSLSAREIEKVALGLNLPAIAFFGLNDEYVNGLHQHPQSESDPVFRDLKTRLEFADRRIRTGVGSSGLLLCAVFVSGPAEDLVEDLRNAGWYVRFLPRNPHC